MVVSFPGAVPASSLSPSMGGQQTAAPCSPRADKGRRKAGGHAEHRRNPAETVVHSSPSRQALDQLAVSDARAPASSRKAKPRSPLL